MIAWRPRLVLAFLAATAILGAGGGCSLTGGEVDAGRDAAAGGRNAIEHVHVPPVGSGFDPAPPLAAVTASKADRSARELSEEVGAKLNDVRESYCSLLEIYESEGSSGAFVPWAMDELGIRGSTRFYAEESLYELEEAVAQAERGEVLGAFVSKVCIG
jgi:hypothetical protein